MGQMVPQELKQGGIRSWLSLAAFSIRNRFVSWMFFLPSFILGLARMFTSATIFYLMGQMVDKGAAAHVAQYGVSYGSYIIVGVMFNSVMSATMSAYHESCVGGYWSTQYDTYLQYPGGVSALLTGDLVAKYLMTSLNTLIYLLVGVCLFGVSVVVSNLLDVLLIMILAIAALTGLGLIGVSTFSLLNAKSYGTNPVEWFVGFGVTLLSGVYFPPTVLPGWLQGIGEWFPQTHALRVGRLCLNGQATLSHPSVAHDVTFLLKFTAVALPIGALLFAVGMRKAQRDGALTRWS